MKYSLINATRFVRCGTIWSDIRILATVAIIVLSAAKNVPATTIAIDLGSPSKLTSQIDIPFAALNGVSLNGQTLSLDFMFTNNEFVRLFTVTSPSFISLLTLQTNGSGLVGFLDGTGYLLDQQGNALQTPQGLGSSSGNDASMDAGLLPLLSGQLQRPLDFIGIHFDLTLPTNPSVATTGGELKLVSEPNRVFGIGPGVPRDIVPDNGSTLLFFSIVLGGLIAAKAPVAGSG